MTKTTACSILEIDSLIEWLIDLSLNPSPQGRDFKKEIEELKQQKLLIYDNCNRL